MSIDWKKGSDIVAATASKVTSEVTEKLKNRIVDLTPVGNPALWKYRAYKGYTPGTLKASWVWSYDSSTETGRIFNPQPYAERVEYGWSTQAPYGMVRIALGEFHAMLIDVSKENKV